MKEVVKTKTMAIAFVAIALSLYVNAQPVNESTALEAAGQWMSAQTNSGDMGLADVDMLRNEESETVVYVVNYRAGGYVLVSAHRDARPILAWSPTGTFTTDEDHKPSDWLVGRYKREISKIAKSKMVYKSARDEWVHLLAGKLQSKAAPVGPLMKLNWYQACLYNDSTPADASGPCGHVYTGCGATAMAMLMRYYQHPMQGTGSHSYTENDYGLLSADFSAASYDYTNMPTRPLIEPNAGVSQLMYHCGVASEMDYSPNGSGTQREKVRDGLVNFFSYSSSSAWLAKTSYSDTDWRNMLRAEIDNARPVMYFGGDFGTGVGHFFFVDGYDGTTMFHINWGWDGRHDGYYSLGSLQPGGGYYTDSQFMLDNCYPAQESGIDLAAMMFRSQGVDVEPGGTLTIEYQLRNNGNTPSGSSWLHYYLSKDMVFQASEDIVIDSADLGSLSAGAVVAGEHVLTLPAAIDDTAGQWYIIALADKDNTISESNEDNNTSTMSINLLDNTLIYIGGDGYTACSKDTVTLMANPMYAPQNAQSRQLMFQDFESISALPDGWAVSTSTANNWAFSSAYPSYAIDNNMLLIKTNQTGTTDSWVYTDSMALEAGRLYRISFYARVYSSPYPEQFKLTVGQGQSSSHQNTVLWSSFSFTSEAYTRFTAFYYCPADGDYNFAFHAFSAASSRNILIDDITIEELASQVLMYEDFTGSSFPPDGWASENNEKNWSRNSQYGVDNSPMAFIANIGGAYDCWLFTKAVELQEGHHYKLAFQMRKFVNSSDEHIFIYAGQGQTSADQSTEIWEKENFSTSYSFFGYQSNTFECDSSGTYYFGFHGNTTSSAARNLILDNLIIYEEPASYDYLWSTGETTSSINVLPGQTNRYYLTVSGISQAYTDSIVFSDAPVQAIVPNDTSLCQGAELALSASGGSYITWSGGINNAELFSPVHTRRYSVSLSNDQGCSDTASVIVSVHPLPDVSLTSDADTVETGNSVLLTASGANTYTWNQGGLSGPEQNYSPMTETTYIVTGTDANGCVGKDSITIVAVEAAADSTDNNSGSDTTETYLNSISQLPIALYPNPSSGMLYYECEDVIDKVEIFNQSSLVKTINMPKSNVIDLGELPAGVYIIRLYSGKAVVVRKISIVR